MHEIDHPSADSYAPAPVTRTLEHREQLLQRAVSQAAVGIAVASPDGCLLDMNARFCALVGQAREALIGRHARTLIHPDDVERAMQLARSTLDGSRSVRGHQVRFLRADGSPTWMQAGVSALTNARGTPEHLIVVATDINERMRIELELESLKQDLEKRIRERTRKLDDAIARLQAEVAERERMQQELQQQRERFRATLKNTNDAFIETDADGRVLMWNRAAETMLGWRRDEVVGRRVSDLIVPPALRDAFDAQYRDFIDSRGKLSTCRRFEGKAMRRDGSCIPIELTNGCVISNGHVLAHAFLRDISERRAQERALRAGQEELKTITDNVPALIARIGSDLRYQFHNQTYQAWFNLPADGLDGHHVREFWGEALYQRLEPTLLRTLDGSSERIEYSLQGRHGPLWINASLVPSFDSGGAVDGLYLLGQDVTEHKHLRQQLEHEALHDALTGLANRRLLMTRISDAMARVRRYGSAMAILFLDLDDFKTMNDVLGHEFGDAALQHLADTLINSLRQCDHVARLAGDEFVVVLENLNNAESAVASIARGLLQKVGTPCEILGTQVRLKLSIGAAIHLGEDEETPQELLTRADAAMYRAKAAGKHQFAF